MQHLLGENRKSLARRAALLQLSARKIADGMRSGTFKSLYYGHGIEFSGVRDYLRGDDVRTIDWNVTARLGKPYVKTFEEERELNVFIIADRSFSMTGGSGKKTRLEVAMECASLLTLASEQNNSPVGAVIFDGEITFSSVPKAGRDQSLLLLTHFDEYNEVHKNGSALDSALHGAERVLKKKSLVFIFSDFRTALWEVPFAHLCAKHDVVAVRIKDKLDSELPSVGSVPFEDIESGKIKYFPTSSEEFRLAWENDNSRRVNEWKKICYKHGAVPFEISTESEPVVELSKFFSQRGQE